MYQSVCATTVCVANDIDAVVVTATFRMSIRVEEVSGKRTKVVQPLPDQYIADY